MMFPIVHGLLQGKASTFPTPVEVFDLGYTPQSTSTTVKLYRSSTYDGIPGTMYGVLLHRAPIQSLPEHWEVVRTQQTAEYTPDPSLEQFTTIVKADNELAVYPAPSSGWTFTFESSGRVGATSILITGDDAFRETVVSQATFQSVPEEVPENFVTHDGPSITAPGNGFIVAAGTEILAAGSSFQEDFYEFTNMTKFGEEGLSLAMRCIGGYVPITKGQTFTPEFKTSDFTNYFGDITLAVTS